MLYSLLALAAVVTADMSPVTAGQGQPEASTTATRTDPFGDRPRARIAFTNDVRNFQVKRDGNDDILYLETQRNRWFRSEIHCIGIGDPRDAQGLRSLDNTSGFDDFSRIALVSFSHGATQCRLNRLVELTPEEAIELRLVRPRRAAPPKAVPAS